MSNAPDWDSLARAHPELARRLRAANVAAVSGDSARYRTAHNAVHAWLDDHRSKDERECVQAEHAQRVRATFEGSS